MAMETLDYVKAVVIFLVLLFGLVFALTATNIVHCGTIGQTWCDTYYSIVGYPKVLVVYGFDGLGNVEKLNSILTDRELFRLRVQVQNVDYIKTSSYLNSYKMVIVTQAKTLSSDQLKMFEDYSSKGVLIWTGDAGTSKMPGDKDPKDFNYTSTSPWLRVTSDNTAFDFGSTISAEYISNFCSYTNCGDPNKDFVGYLVKESSDNPITGGIRDNNTALYGDFALVNLINNTSTSMDLSVDFKTNIMSKDTTKVKGLNTNVVPIMIRSGLGKNIVYLAVPIENLIAAKDPNFINTGTEIPTTIKKLFEEYFGKLK